MPLCQAWGCSNRNDRGEGTPGFGKSFFQIPNASKHPEKKLLADRWLHNMGTGWTSATFTFGRHKVVCQDHFEQNCFKPDLTNRLLGRKEKLQLRDDAFPTLFVHRPKQTDGLREERLRKRTHKKNVAEMFSTCAGDLEKKKRSSLTLDDKFMPILTVPEEIHSQETDVTIEQSTRSVGVQTDYWCPDCFQPNHHMCPLTAEDSVRSSDHTYHKVPEEENLVSITASLPMQSTPVKLPENEYAVENLDVTFESIKSTDQTDSPFEVTRLSSEFESDTDKSDVDDSFSQDVIHNILSNDKYIVFSDALDDLFHRIPCKQCSCPVDEVKRSFFGSVITVKLFCTGGHEILFWKSQPCIAPRVAAGNVLLSASILFTGQTYQHVADVASLMNLKFVGKSSFYETQRDYLLPVIEEFWKAEQQSVVTSLTGLPVQVIGDGRCDSPGYSAKYCNYTMMDHNSLKIVDFEVVEVTECKSSAGMEKIGFERVLDRLVGCNESNFGFNLAVSDVCTDRHVSVRKLMREKYRPMNIDHQFNPYHLSNNLRKKLQEKCRYRKFSALAPWVQSICNHLWWCAASCGGDSDLLVARWESLRYHIVNCHEWAGPGLVTSCSHGQLSENEMKKKKWLTRDSAAHRALEEIILNKRFFNDIKMMSKFMHTGRLEVYHSLLNKYCPKRQDFDKKQMTGRTKMAALDHNNHTHFSHNQFDHVHRDEGISPESTSCPQTPDSSRLRVAYSKHCKDWVVKPIAEHKSHKYLTDMISAVLKRRREAEKGEVSAKSFTANIARKPKPTKQFLINRHISRLTKL